MPLTIGEGWVRCRMPPNNSAPDCLRGFFCSPISSRISSSPFSRSLFAECFIIPPRTDEWVLHYAR